MIGDLQVELALAGYVGRVPVEMFPYCWLPLVSMRKRDKICNDIEKHTVRDLGPLPQ